MSGINISFFSSKTIIASPRSESLSYVRNEKVIENSELKISYIPKGITVKAHGIYLGDTIVENVAGNAYLKIIRTLDEETEVQVSTLRLKSLNEIFDSKTIRNNQNGIDNETNLNIN